MIDKRAPRGLASQEGFALMEVIISASILVIVVLGVLAALDGVTRAAGGNQARTIAATLAEQDQERLRSLPTGDLNKLSTLELPSRPVKVGAVTYTVASSAKWVADSDGAELSCAIVPGEGSYLRITSTVTSPITGARVRPVVLSSIVAPRPGKGTLTAMVRNAAGVGVAGIGVQAIGPTPDTRTTNAAGCAVFDESDAGSYVLKLSTTDWVDPNGVTAPEKNATVSAGNLTTVEFIYDHSSAFTVAVKTKRPGAPAEVSDLSTNVMAAHSGLTLTYKRLPVTPIAPPGLASFSYSLMFPFSTPYMLYSGSCTGNNPASFPGLANYFTTRTSSIVQLTPGGPTVGADVLEPAMDVTASFSSANVSGASVYAYPKTAGCDAARILLGTTQATTGTVPNPGLPFGTYDICVDYDPPGGTHPRRRRIFTNQLNTNVNGTALTAIIPTSGGSSSCGATTPTS
jgi:hypothetical protein